MTPAMAQALQQSQMLQASQDPLPQSLMDVTADVTKGLAAGLVGASNYMLGTPEALRNQDALAKGQVQGLMPDRDSVFSFVDSPTGSSMWRVRGMGGSAWVVALGSPRPPLCPCRHARGHMADTQVIDGQVPCPAMFQAQGPIPSPVGFRMLT